jgi:diguanylate cyclase (GGDEF)-like protein
VVDSHQVKREGFSVPRGASTPAGTDYDRHPNLASLIRNVGEILNSEVALYCHLGGSGQPPEVICSWGVGALHDQVVRLREGGLVDRALGAQRTVFEALHPDRNGALIGAAADPPLPYVLIAPARPATGAASALVAVLSELPANQTLIMWTAEACAAMLALGAHRPELLDTLVPAGRLDALTGCLNYAGIRREVEKEVNRSTRGHLDLSLGFIDLDDFKRVNDKHGHLFGNEVLRGVAAVLRESVRGSDTVGRFGGDEFIVILPDTAEADAHHLGERLRGQISAISIETLGGPLTASVGIAPWSAGVSADELLARADAALLRAKADTHSLASPRAQAGSDGRSATAATAPLRQAPA